MKRLALVNSFISGDGGGEGARGGRGARRAHGGRGGRGRDRRTEEDTREGERSRLPGRLSALGPRAAAARREGSGAAEGAQVERRRARRVMGGARRGLDQPRATAVTPPGHPVAGPVLADTCTDPRNAAPGRPGKVLREREPGRSPGLLEAFGPPDAWKIFSSFSSLFAETFDCAFPRR